MQFPLTGTEIRLIAGLGFSAINSGHSLLALGIFLGLRRLRPAHAFSFIGEALAHMTMGAFDEALGCLAEAKKVVESDRDELNLYQGLAHALLGEPDHAEKILCELLKKNTLGDAQRIFLNKMLHEKQFMLGSAPWPIPATISARPSFADSSDSLNRRNEKSCSVKNENLPASGGSCLVADDDCSGYFRYVNNLDIPKNFKESL